MQTITASHLKMNQPPTISNGYKNWWDVVGQSSMPIQPIQPMQSVQLQPIQSIPVQAPSYGVYAPLNTVTSLTPFTGYQQPQLQSQLQSQPMSLITSIKGCGCHGAK